MSVRTPVAGSHVIVVGAAGEIGYAISARLLREGAALFMADLSESVLAERLTHGSSDERSRVHTGDIDLADPDSIRAAATKAADLLGPIDALVCAAGVSRQGVSFEEESAAGWASVLAVNLTGPFLLAQAVAPSLRPGGSMLFVSSSGADSPLPGNMAYGASKAGLNHLTQSLSRHFAPQGIRVNAVSPGLMEHPMRQGSQPAKPRSGMEDRVPLGRLGRGDDIASMVAHLLRPESDWITGQIVRVDGGMSAR